MTVRDFLQWWGGQLAGLLPPDLRQRRSGAGRLALVELLSPVGVTPPIVAVSQAPRRNQPERREILSLSAAGLGQLSLLLGPRRRKFRLRLPPGVLLQRDVVLPIAAERAPEQVLHLELDRLTPFRTAEVYWGCRVLRRDPLQGRLHMRLTLAPRENLTPLLDMLKDAGVAPALLEAPPGVGAPAADWRRIDLDASEAARRRWPGTRVGMALCAGLAMAVVAVPFVRQSLALAAIQAQVEAVASDAAEASELRRRLSATATSGEAMQGQRQRLGDPLQVLAGVTEALPDDTWLTDLTLNRRRLTLAGQSANAVRLIARLSAESGLRNAAFIAPVTRIEGGHGDLFSIGAELAP